MAAVIGLAVALVLAAAWSLRAVRSLRARVAALESAPDASGRWEDEVRRVLAASKPAGPV